MDSHASKPLRVQAHDGPYDVVFIPGCIRYIRDTVPPNAHFVVDCRVAELYAEPLAPVLASPSVMLIDATEQAKSLDRFPAYVEQLVRPGLRRGHVLVAVGGGVTQDITCFLAAILLRGLDWWFYPTTLLAQADSCIGSKSSINVGRIKNILGTFTPPRKVLIDRDVLATLADQEMRSGFGEMLKVHAIAGPEAFDAIAIDYPRLGSPNVLQQYIYRSLELKRGFIEQDEFDVGVRRVMNYGHTFGHAIEAATEFAIPHGIAVTIGADMANYVAMGLGRTSRAHYQRMHASLRRNYEGFERVPIPRKEFFDAIAKDKKNIDTALTLILPDEHGRIGPTTCADDARFRDICTDYLERQRA